MFTYPYAQPPAYRFSLDSIEFAEWLAETLRTRADLATLRVLDLCAGCGVIGIELSWHLRALRQIDFLEVQTCYTDYFQENIRMVNRQDIHFNWHPLNYDVLQQPAWHQRYNIIISNPPYFKPEQSVLSPSEFKNRCRFFMDSSFEQFILGMAATLTNGGQAYFLLRSREHYGEDVYAELTALLTNTTVTAKKITQLRGTDIVMLQKNN